MLFDHFVNPDNVSIEDLSGTINNSVCDQFVSQSQMLFF